MILTFLLQNYRTIAIVLLVISIGLWLERRGYDNCKAEQAVAIQKEESKHDVIERKNMGLSDSDIDKRLCAHWMRSPCPKRHL